MQYYILIYLTILTHHILSLSVLIYYLSGLKDENVPKDENKYTKLIYTNRYKFLTIWNFLLQIIYLFASVANCVLSMQQNNKSLLEIHRKLSKMLRYANIALISPLAYVIFLLFWMVFTIDREIVYPKIMDIVMMPIINHSMHSFIIILPSIEMFMHRNLELPSFKSTSSGLTCFFFIFLYVLLGTYYYESIWVYGFLDVLPWPAKIWFFVVTYSGGISMLGLVTLIHTNLFSNKTPKTKSD